MTYGETVQPDTYRTLGHADVDCPAPRLVTPLPTYKRARECSQPMEIHMTMINPATMTVTQAAMVLGISRSSAYECVRLGTIPSIRLGRRIVIPRRSLDELLATARLDQPDTA